MRTTYGYALAAIALIGFATPAFADAIVTVEYTADNIVAGFYQDGAAPVAIAQGGGASLSNWTVSDTETLTLLSGHSYQLVFRVQNAGPWSDGNPAAFLAELSGDIVGGPILTGSNWETAVYGGSTPTDFNSLTWSSAYEYGELDESDGQNIWNNNVAASSSFNRNAEWIWDSTNYAGGQNADLWLRVTFSTLPVPEPTSFALLGLGLLGLAATQRRRKLRIVTDAS